MCQFKPFLLGRPVQNFWTKWKFNVLVTGNKNGLNWHINDRCARPIQGNSLQSFCLVFEQKSRLLKMSSIGLCFWLVFFFVLRNAYCIEMNIIYLNSISTFEDGNISDHSQLATQMLHNVLSEQFPRLFSNISSTRLIDTQKRPPGSRCSISMIPILSHQYNNTPHLFESPSLSAENINIIVSQGESFLPGSGKLSFFLCFRLVRLTTTRHRQLCGRWDTKIKLKLIN